MLIRIEPQDKAIPADLTERVIGNEELPKVLFRLSKRLRLAQLRESMHELCGRKRCAFTLDATRPTRAFEEPSRGQRNEQEHRRDLHGNAIEKPNPARSRIGRCRSQSNIRKPLTHHVFVRTDPERESRPNALDVNNIPDRLARSPPSALFRPGGSLQCKRRPEARGAALRIRDGSKARGERHFAVISNQQLR